jgi:hypothetical protein
MLLRIIDSWLVKAFESGGMFFLSLVRESNLRGAEQ